MTSDTRSFFGGRRRDIGLVCLGMCVVVFGATYHAWHAPAAPTPTPLDPGSVTKYLDPLPVPPKLDGSEAQAISISEFTQQVLPSDFTAGPYGGQTLVWGYNGSYPGPTIEARRGVPFKVTFRNTLVAPALLQFLTVDQSLHWADPLGCHGGRDCGEEPYRGPVPVVTHLHGGEVPSAFDGHPEAWFTPHQAAVGPKWVAGEYTYPNTQEAATLWYHDHAIGITRLNVYAGLGGFYLLRDAANEPEDLPADDFERELVIQDRMFDTDGQLFYPANTGSPGTRGSSWIPMFMGDTIVVNGKAWPYLNVEPRRYRLRLLNGSNARSYTLRFTTPDGTAGPGFWQIGTDGGLLNNPLHLSVLSLAPGERADVIVDFAAATGESFILSNLDTAPSWSGSADHVGEVLKVNVVLPLTDDDDALAPAADSDLRPNNPIVPLSSTVTSSTVTRRMTLEKDETGFLLNGKPFQGAVTEVPQVGATEVWLFDNRTGDLHPIHLHLVQFQVLSGAGYEGGSWGSGGAIGGTLAWKDTVRVDPWSKVSVVVRWAPQNLPPAQARAGVNHFPFEPSTEIGAMDRFGYPGGPGYVWHCHILEHEDNDMMRPYQVRP